MAAHTTTEGERRVLADAPSGNLVDLGDLDEDQRVVSADVIRRLCVGPEAEGVDPRGLRIKNARIVGPLDLSFCTVAHPLRFEETTFDAAVDLTWAHVPALWIQENSSLQALLGDGLQVDHDLRVSSTSVSGKVLLLDARIGGLLSFRNAKLVTADANALFADRVKVDGSVFLDDGFAATGAVHLNGARIGGQLVCEDATLTETMDLALAARDSVIGSSLVFRDVRVTGAVDLFRASATILADDLGRADDPLGSWRDADPLVLDGFTYARFGAKASWDSNLRRSWLEHTTGFQHGAWQQLIAVYRAQGRDDEATRSAVAMHNDRVKRGGLPWYRRAARVILWAVVGHGYRPWIAGVWAGAIIVLFALAVWHWSGLFVAAKQGTKGSPQPLAYAVDTFLPIVNLGQTDAWTATGWFRWVVWTVILLGWGLTTLFVAGFTRIVRNE